MASLPDGHRADERAERKARRPRRGCTFFLGLLLLLIVGAMTVTFFFGSFLFSDGLPSFGDAIGVVRVESAILSPDEALKDLKRLEENASVRGILVRIDSPGGAVGASQELYSALLRSEKPIYASLGNTAASGGYYIASAADRIFANPGTVTGSIGVIFQLTNWEDLVEKIGLKFEVVKSGRYKDIGSPNRPLSPEERRILQALIDDAYGQFTEAILDTRAALLEDAMRRQADEGFSVLGDDFPATITLTQYVSQIADGRLFTGRQAMALGLVDEMGSMQDALEILAEDIGLEEPRIIEYKRKLTLFDLLASKVGFSLPTGRADAARLSYRMWVE